MEVQFPMMDGIIVNVGFMLKDYRNMDKIVLPYSIIIQNDILEHEMIKKQLINLVLEVIGMIFLMVGYGKDFLLNILVARLVTGVTIVLEPFGILI